MITAAALIMVAVFGAFVAQPRGLPQADRHRHGRRRSSIDATMVRMVLVPAMMQLLGERNWWLPRWIGRLLPERLRPREPDRLRGGERRS